MLPFLGVLFIYHLFLLDDLCLMFFKPCFHLTRSRYFIYLLLYLLFYVYIVDVY